MVPFDCDGGLDRRNRHQFIGSYALDERVFGASDDGELMGAVMKRFRSLVYASIVVLGATGILMNFLNENYLGLLRFGNPWSQISLIKHIFTVALIILAVYAFEGLGPKVSRLATKGPSPELARLQRLQIKLATTGLIMGIIILLLTGIATAIS